MKSLGLVTDDEITRFSAETREAIQFLLAAS